MKLQDYAKYYIGCRCLDTWFPEGHEHYNNNWILSGYVQDMEKPYCLENKLNNTWTDSIKLILRRLEDMTDEDIKSFIGYERLCRMYTDVSYKRHNSRCITVYYTIEADGEVGPQAYDIHLSQLDSLQFHHLLKAGFDMFFLIKNGFAIDSKTLK